MCEREREREREKWGGGEEREKPDRVTFNFEISVKLINIIDIDNSLKTILLYSACHEFQNATYFF